MKKLIYIIAAVAMTLTACNKEAADPTDQGKKGTPLAIDVEVVSPTNSTNPANSASPSTRATDTGYNTAFEAGDAIGIWVYEGTTEVYANKQWVRQANGTWSPATADDEIYYNGTAMTIKAYFPYNDAATALPTAVAFAVKADQSTLANYRASDLLLSTSQTWGGTATTLPLTFAHAMAMVEALPSSSKDLQSVTMAAKTSDGATAATALTFYKFGDGIYRALLPAQTLATSLFFNYTTDSYAFPTTTALAGGSYYKYDVITVPAAVGDYYYDDGSYSATYPVTGKICVGIVFRAKTDAQNGLVVSLKQSPSTLEWGPRRTTTYATDEDNGAVNMTKITATPTWRTTYPAFVYCYNYGTSTAFARKWYLPAKNELKAIYNNKNTINTKLSNANGEALYNSSYWSSSQGDRDDAWALTLSNANTYETSKSSKLNVRAILAF